MKNQKKQINMPTKKDIHEAFADPGAENDNVIDKEFREIEVDELKPHPQNELIYGNDEDVTDLKDQIEAFGSIIDALKITDNYIIISGHRRWKAAKELGFKTVTCEFVNFESQEEELAALVLYNYKRIKTNEQRIREGIALHETISDDAIKRKLGNLIQNRTDVADSAMSDNDENNAPSNTDGKDKGLTRDKVAKAVGIKSGREFDRMKKVIDKADELKNNGSTEDSELFITVLNRSFGAANDLLKVEFENLSIEDKDLIKKGKAPRAFIKKNESDKKKTTEYASAKEHIKVIDLAIQALKKVDVTQNTDKQTQEINDKIKAIIENLQEILPSDDSPKNEL